jgi:hypothetical protein
MSAVENWFTPQAWKRVSNEPSLSLGEYGAFDDMHMFAPCVANEGDGYRMWYCGSRAEVADRVFALGLAQSDDGVTFQRLSTEPVAAFADGRTSIMTPTLLRNADGTVRREDGRLRMFLSAADLTPTSDGLHTLRDMTSDDGVSWSEPSEPLLRNLYAPTIVHDGQKYRLWYTDPSSDPWVIRHAHSADGRQWNVTPKPVIVIDQEWEINRLFYPFVLQIDGVWLMWYGSYRSDSDVMRTSLGLAVSHDGITWQKSPVNPVFGPDESRRWESHFTTSHTVLRIKDGALRIWYATRPAPPFNHKYFAIGSAEWDSCPCDPS